MSGSKQYSYRLDDTRKRRLNKIEDDIQKDSRAAAIDEADQHALSTWALSVSVGVELE